jgi:hypothetical protein
MYGVDMTKPGAQAYYDSIFALYASWGVGFIKMDDMSRPYDAHAAEIEAAHLAIEKTGRPMLLSLSPGETPVIRGEHVGKHAQMWRISDDFWDEWPLLEAQFVRLENWTPYRRPGAWPGPDMLPLGRLALGARDSRFIPDEQQTLMSLWAITKSPLIMGGDLRHLDDATLRLLTNRDVINLNQHSTDNRPHFVMDGIRVWTARGPNDEIYVSVFNITDKPRTAELDLARLGIAGRAGRDLWTGQPVASADGQLNVTLAPHASLLCTLRP